MDLFYHESLPLDMITGQLPGCKCNEDCFGSSTFCECHSKYGQTYNSQGYLTNFAVPIFECNSECSCSELCPNRLIQRHLERLLTMTHAQDTYLDHLYLCNNNSVKGRGLKTLRGFNIGELVCVYLGEVVPYAEACQRELRQLSAVGHNYVMVLREYAEKRLVCETCVDGSSHYLEHKPLTRFINHSCNPNLTVAPVRVDNLIPYFALFANQFIAKDSEVTYNYAQSVPVNDLVLSSRQCVCGSSNCCKYLPRVSL